MATVKLETVECPNCPDKKNDQLLQDITLLKVRSSLYLKLCIGQSILLAAVPWIRFISTGKRFEKIIIQLSI